MQFSMIEIKPMYVSVYFNVTIFLSNNLNGAKIRHEFTTVILIENIGLYIAMLSSSSGKLYFLSWTMVASKEVRSTRQPRMPSITGEA